MNSEEKSVGVRQSLRIKLNSQHPNDLLTLTTKKVMKLIQLNRSLQLPKYTFYTTMCSSAVRGKKLSHVVSCMEELVGFTHCSISNIAECCQLTNKMPAYVEVFHFIKVIFCPNIDEYLQALKQLKEYFC